MFPVFLFFFSLFLLFVSVSSSVPIVLPGFGRSLSYDPDLHHHLYVGLDSPQTIYKIDLHGNLIHLVSFNQTFGSLGGLITPLGGISNSFPPSDLTGDFVISVNNLLGAHLYGVDYLTGQAFPLLTLEECPHFSFDSWSRFPLVIDSATRTIIGAYERCSNSLFAVNFAHAKPLVWSMNITLSFSALVQWGKSSDLWLSASGAFLYSFPLSPRSPDASQFILSPIHLPTNWNVSFIRDLAFGSLNDLFILDSGSSQIIVLDLIKHSAKRIDFNAGTEVENSLQNPVSFKIANQQGKMVIYVLDTGVKGKSTGASIYVVDVATGTVSLLQTDKSPM
jgi:hypothetical protein